MATVHDMARYLAGDTGRNWREEMLAASTAELERIRAENSAVLEKVASSDLTFDVTSLIHTGLRAIAEITTDDVVRYARGMLADSETRDSREVLLALGAIWIWGRERSKAPRTDAEILSEPLPEAQLQLGIADAVFWRWFISLSASTRVHLVLGFAGLLAESSAELEVLGVWDPPGAANAHLGFITSFIAFSYAVVAARRE